MSEGVTEMVTSEVSIHDDGLVEEALHVVESIGWFVHVEAHRERIKELIHVPERETRC